MQVLDQLGGIRRVPRLHGPSVPPGGLGRNTSDAAIVRDADRRVAARHAEGAGGRVDLAGEIGGPVQLRPARCEPRARPRIERCVRAVSVLVDTSALYALLDRDDQDHEAALAALPALAEQELITHSYVLMSQSR